MNINAGATSPATVRMFLGSSSTYRPGMTEVDARLHLTILLLANHNPASYFSIAKYMCEHSNPGQPVWCDIGCIDRARMYEPVSEEHRGPQCMKLVRVYCKLVQLVGWYVRMDFLMVNELMTFIAR